MTLNVIRINLKSILQLLEAFVHKEARAEVMCLMLVRSFSATFWTKWTHAELHGQLIQGGSFEYFALLLFCFYVKLLS